MSEDGEHNIIATRMLEYITMYLIFKIVWYTLVL